MGIVMSENDPEMKEYQKNYIELIARKVGKEVSVILEKRLNNHEKRISKMEKKVFNGFGTKINVLFGFYGVMIVLLIKMAFFK